IPGPRVISQPAMLAMLAAEAGRHPSFRLERGASVRDLVWDDGRVVGVQADSAEGGRKARGDLVIGADGRSSTFRSRGGLQGERNPQGFDVVWCKVPLPSFSQPETAHAYLGTGHSALAYPSYDGRMQIAWVIEKGSFGALRREGIDEWIDQMAD